MAQGQTSGAQNAIDSLMTEMETWQITPATVVDASACLISWVSDDSAQYNFKPDKVHIGPLHLNPSHWMEKEKKKLLHDLLESHRPRHQEELRRYLTAMEGNWDLARQFYKNRTFSNINKEAFACMLLLDGYFLYSRFVATTAPHAPVGSSDITVVRDVVFLLENQIPFFVLEKIHKLITPGADGDDSAGVVLDSVARHVETLVQRHDYSTFTLDRARARPCHLLHLLYMYFRPTALDAAREFQLNPLVNGNATLVSAPPEENMTTPLAPVRWRAATYYYVAGVRLVPRELDRDKARSILDVELKGGTLKVPCLRVDSNTLRMLRNMVALEQHNPRLGSHVTAYCLFMSQMANTEKDVALLHTKGIIVHFLHSDDDVAKYLAELCDGVILNVNNPHLNYLSQEHKKLEKLCGNGWRKSMAWLRHSKCNNYLMALAVVAAFIVFICAVVQSVFAVVSYAKGKND